MVVKYIKTEKNEIIVFSELQIHSEFKHFEPVSAGFVDIFVNEEGEIDCKCYGESVSLGLQSLVKDKFLIKRQILGNMF